MFGSLWTNPWVLDTIKIKQFILRWGHRLKIENPASLGSLKVPQEPECVLNLYLKYCIFFLTLEKQLN